MSKDPVAKAETMIRAPVAKVFEAFVDPAVTTKFWFSKASGPLVAGETVQWGWEMYGHADRIQVRAIEADKTIIYDWGGQGNLSRVEMTFTGLEDGQTFVEVTNGGFHGDAESVVAQALDSNGGFTTVLCAAKVWLEHGINARLIEDKFPQALAAGWTGR
ncbi:MAG: SRPBCC family protein [Caulobacter sp.]|nr:SRPBCC family protein [Caulobacter sp.]